MIDIAENELHGILPDYSRYRAEDVKGGSASYVLHRERDVSLVLHAVARDPTQRILPRSLM